MSPQDRKEINSAFILYLVSLSTQHMPGKRSVSLSPEAKAGQVRDTRKPAGPGQSRCRWLPGLTFRACWESSPDTDKAGPSPGHSGDGLTPRHAALWSPEKVEVRKFPPWVFLDFPQARDVDLISGHGQEEKGTTEDEMVGWHH